MSDRTFLQIEICDAPDAELAAIETVFETFDLRYEQESDSTESEGRIRFGSTAQNEEICCGSASLIAQKLIACAPGASWSLWEDPKYEWLGDLFLYTPTLGVFNADCSSGGDAVFTASEVLMIWANNESEAARRLALGETHRQALAEVAAAVTPEA